MSVAPLPLDPSIISALSGVTTATLTTVLLKKGLRNVWVRGAMPLKEGRRALWAGRLRCVLCLLVRIWPRLRLGGHPFLRAPPLRPCPMVALLRLTLWA